MWQTKYIRIKPYQPLPDYGLRLEPEDDPRWMKLRRTYHLVDLSPKKKI